MKSAWLSKIFTMNVGVFLASVGQLTVSSFVDPTFTIGPINDSSSLVLAVFSILNVVFRWYTTKGITLSKTQ